jgi:NAD+ kinase
VRVAILAKHQEPRAVEAARQVQDWLLERGHDVRMDALSAADPDGATVQPRAGLADGAELAIVLGGDGTLLLASRLFSPKAVPIFGVNMGRLGFLTDTDAERLWGVLPRVLAGEYRLEERMMLSGEVLREGQRVAGPLVALNDLVVNKGALAQVVRVETRVDGRFVSSYLADGIIAATPTGSTAYGLAVGGPIVVPEAEVILVAPICPHILTNRPLILPADVELEVKLAEARGEVYLTIDGQEGCPMQAGDLLRVWRSPHRARIVHAESTDFFGILRTKLGWGGHQ